MSEKHIEQEGSREHVTFWTHFGKKCSHPDCELNFPPNSEQNTRGDLAKTPETDAAVLPWIAHTQSAFFPFDVVKADFARTLERENNRLRASDRLSHQLMGSNDLITKDLHAEFEKDKARLDWLSDRDATASRDDDGTWGVFIGAKPIAVEYTLREAIDAAMKQTP